VAVGILRKELKNVPFGHICQEFFGIVSCAITTKVKTASTTRHSKRVKSLPENPVDCFISKADVAARLGKTARTVEQWMMRGVIPYIKIGKGRRASVLFKWADIEAHLKSNFGVGLNFDQ